MSAIDRLPMALRNRSSVVSMAGQLDRSRAEAARLRKEAKSGPGLVKAGLPTLGGSFGAGWMDARMPTVGGTNVKPSTALGLIGLGGSYMTGNEMGLFASLGLLAPSAYAAGVKAAGYELAVLETTEDDAGDTA